MARVKVIPKANKNGSVLIQYLEWALMEALLTEEPEAKTATVVYDFGKRTVTTSYDLTTRPDA